MTSIQVQLDEALKRDAQEVASALGMEVATAIRIFLCQMVRDRGLPFTPSLHPQAAMEYKVEVHGCAQEKTEREEWLRKAVHTGLTALENDDFALDGEVRATFRKAGANVG